MDTTRRALTRLDRLPESSLLLGASLVVLGVLAATLPLLPEFSRPRVAARLVGMVLLVAAGGHAVQAWTKHTQQRRIGLELLLTALYVVAGVSYLVDSVASFVRFGTLLGVFLVCHGLLHVGYGFRHRPAAYWPMMFVGGALAVTFGLLVLFREVPPVYGTRGALIGFALVVTGVAWVFVGRSTATTEDSSRDTESV
ncbi:HdeD family acid-resistance protein [Haloarchaeobius sp. DT45]|uniref:HdeD family acid-resistance protein n=1 Tax=Haloarchaeobius sp. DT45 TaxID=3446116 RepID=UPI003F6ADD9E